MKNENNKIVRKSLTYRIAIPFITVLLIVAFGGTSAYGLLNVEPSDIKTKCLIIIAYSLMCIMMIISTLYALLWKIEINGQDVIIRTFIKKVYKKNEIKIAMEQVKRRKCWMDMYVIRLKKNSYQLISFAKNDDNVEVLDHLIVELREMEQEAKRFEY